MKNPWHRTSIAAPVKDGVYEVTYQSFVTGERVVSIETWTRVREEWSYLLMPKEIGTIIAWRLYLLADPYDGEE